MESRGTFRRTQSEYVGKEGLRALVDNSFGPCLSFFLPDHIQASKQRLFDLMLDADRQLEPQTYGRARVDELLEPRNWEEALFIACRQTRFLARSSAAAVFEY